MTDQQPYQIVQSHEVFQVRRYPKHLLAEVITRGTFDQAGKKAFRYLFSYITGENHSSQKLSMTSPVVQDSAAETLEMTAPVLQQGFDVETDLSQPAGFRVAFVLPEGSTLENVPKPNNSLVRIRAVPESLSAVIDFSGRWTEANYDRHLKRLRQAVADAGLRTVGSPRFAKFDPPMKPSFMRRNEIVLDLVDNLENTLGGTILSKG